MEILNCVLCCAVHGINGMSCDSLVSQEIGCGLDEWNPFSDRDRVYLTDMFRVIWVHLTCLVLGRPECEGDC